MFAHLIHHKGKGGWVIAIPLIIAVILFIAFDICEISTSYIGTISLFFSAVVLWRLDHGHEWLHYRKEIRPKRPINSLMWIEVKYWAIILIFAAILSLVKATS